MKNSIKLMFIILFIIVAIPAFTFLYYNYNSTHFSCSATYTAINNQNVFLSKNSLNINGTHGTWMMDGKITYPDAEPFFFKLRNSFRVEKVNFSYHFYSEKVSVTSNRDTYSDNLHEFLADILIKENVDSFFYIYPLNKDYVIFSGSMPIMYCMKSK